jgi:hypothetical protein
VKAIRSVSCAGLVLLCPALCFGFIRLTAPTREAFEHYAAVTEAEWEQSLHSSLPLYADTQSGLKERLRAGEMVIERRTTEDNGSAINAPVGKIHDWFGTMFIPGATLVQVRSAMQDYENYKNTYQPEVIDSKLNRREGDEFDIFLRLYKKQIITVVFNTNYHVRYGMVDPRHMFIISRSTRIAEVKDPKRGYTEELPPGNDTGFLWRLNAYWRFEEADGGVYAECRAISLSRDVPLGLGWMIGSFVEKFPREALINTLRATRKAVQSPEPRAAA